MTHVSGNIIQSQFRFRNDDGSETTATWIDALNTNVSLTAGSTYRLRITLQETAGGSANAGFHLYVSYNGGAYTFFNNTAIGFGVSTNVTDEQATTQQLSGTGTFTAGLIDSGGNGTSSIGVDPNGNTEVEYVLHVPASSFAGATYSFRVYLDTDVALSNYTVTPTVTVAAASQNITDSITLTKSATTSTQRLLETLQATTISSSNTLNTSKALETLVQYLISNTLNIETDGDLASQTINAILSIDSSYSVLKSASLSVFKQLLLAQVLDSTAVSQALISATLSLVKNTDTIYSSNASASSSLILNSTATIDNASTLLALAQLVLSHSKTTTTDRLAVLDAILQLTSAYSKSSLEEIIYAAGVYLATAQDLAGTKQKQTIETWTDSQITWTTVQGSLPLDTALEHAVVTTAGEVAWSPYTVIITGSGEVNAALLINKSTGLTLLKYLDTTKNTVVTSEYTLANIASLVSTLALDLNLNITDQELANLITSLSINLDADNTFNVARNILTTQNLSVSSIQDLIQVATAEYNENISLTSILTELHNRDITVDTQLLLTNLTNFTLNNILSAIASATFTKFNILGITSEVFGDITGNLVLTQNITQEYAATLIGNALLALNTQTDIDTFNNFISNVSIGLFNTLDYLTASSIIANSIVNFAKEATLSTDAFAGAVSTLVLNHTLNLEDACTLLSTVVAIMSSEYSDTYVYEFIANVILNLNSNADVEIFNTLITTLVSSLNQNYRLVALPLGQAIEFLVFNTSITIENLNTLISTVVFELLKTISHQEVATFITSVTTSLVSNLYIEEARHIVRSGTIALLNNVGLTPALELIAQANLILNTDNIISNSFDVIRLANLVLDKSYNTELSAIGNYLVSTLLDTNIVEDIQNTAILNNSIELSGLIRSLFDTLSQNEARINLNYSVLLSSVGFSELFAALQLIFDSTLTNDVARLLFTSVDLSTEVDVETLNTLEALASITIDYEQELLETVTRDIQTAISLAVENNTEVVSSLIVDGIINLNTEVQETFNRLGILNSEVQIQNIVSLNVLKTAILNAGIDINNLMVIETEYGFDLLARTPDNRILLIRVDNRQMTVTFEDRTKILTSEDRTIIIPGRS
jgi:hypothetical protein